jgi:mitogen-activated protein kinase kinase kinase
MGVIKYVDFGAAKVLAKNQRTMQRSRRAADLSVNPAAGALGALGGGLAVNNSLTGTPMYMSPEVIKNDKRGRQGAMDIWSLGCVVLEFATGRKPWSNLDNEWWAVVFQSLFEAVVYKRNAAGLLCSTLVWLLNILRSQIQAN